MRELLDLMQRYDTVPTDKRVDTHLGRRFLTPWGAAWNAKQLNKRIRVPSYRWEVLQNGMLDFRVVAYQNALIRR